MLVWAIAACGCYAPDSGEPGPGPLIELDLLLAPARFEAPLLSPDGAWISYLAPVEGAMNFFLAPVDDPHNARQVSHRVGRGVQAREPCLSRDA